MGTQTLHVPSAVGGIDIEGVKRTSKESEQKRRQQAQEEREAMERNKRQAEQAAVMMGRGVTPSQLSAYTGIKLVPLEQDDKPTLKVTPSNQFVDRDSDGEAKSLPKLLNLARY